jgi:signal transduction histidine kinase
MKRGTSDRIFLLGSIHLIGTLLFVLFGFLYRFFLGSVALCNANMLFGLLCAINGLLPRRWISETLRAHFFLLICYLSLLNSAGHIGVETIPMAFWGLAICVAAAFFLTPMAVVGWIAAVLFFYPAIWLLKLTVFAGALVPLDGYQSQMLAWSIYAALVLAFLFLFFHFRHRVQEEMGSLRRSERERRKLERRLFQAQKMESLGVMAGGLAHDFNNLLATILGNLSLAQSLLPESEKDLHHALDDIDRATRQASDLTRQMLNFSGKGRFVIQGVIMNAVAREMVELMRISVPKDVEIVLDLGADLPSLKADLSQVRQVLMNLIINAGEAIGPGKIGKVSIRTYTQEIDDSAILVSETILPMTAGPHVILEVSDTGCGIDETTRQKLFDPFFTTKMTGRGLGLAAVLGIVRSHQGGLWVRSKVGEGTAFVIALPVETPPMPSSEGPLPLSS